MFNSRKTAGQELAQKLNFLKEKDCIVLGIPRGGVVVAYEVAKELNAPLDVEIPRKVGAPLNPETAIGAVTEDGTAIWNQKMISLLNVSEEKKDHMIKEQISEIARRTKQYRRGKEKHDLDNKYVVLVDDGVATGYTIAAAIKSIKKHNPKKFILAVPVAPNDTFEKLQHQVDECICLVTPINFYAVGQFYENFEQTTDEEVKELLKETF